MCVWQQCPILKYKFWSTKRRPWPEQQQCSNSRILPVPQVTVQLLTVTSIFSLNTKCCSSNLAIRIWILRIILLKLLRIMSSLEKRRNKPGLWLECKMFACHAPRPGFHPKPSNLSDIPAGRRTDKACGGRDKFKSLMEN